MARRLFTDNADRLVYTLQGSTVSALPGTAVTVYLDQAATQVADLRTPANGPVPGSRLTLDATGRIPLFLGPDNDTDTLYVKPDGSSVVTDVRARNDERLDSVEAGIASALAKLSTFQAPSAQNIDFRGRNVRSIGDKLYARLVGTTPPGQVRIMEWGDSVSGLKLARMLPTLSRAYGNGSEVPYGQVTSNGSSGTFSQPTNRFDLWPTGDALVLSAGATFSWGEGGVSARWDESRFFYFKETGAGTFRILVDGADASGTVSAGGSGLGIVTLTKPRTASGGYNAHSFTVECLTGTVAVRGPKFFRTQAPGVFHDQIQRGGLSLQDAMSTVTGRANLRDYMANMQHDVVTHEMKESSTYYLDALRLLFQVFQDANPSLSVIAIGSTPLATGDADQVLQNQQLQQAAQEFSYNYWDGYAPFGSYATLQAFEPFDGVHPGLVASTFLAGLLLRDLGFVDHAGAGTGKELEAHRDLRVTDIVRLGRLRPDPLDRPQAEIRVDTTFGEDVTYFGRRNLDLRGPNDATDPIVSFVLGGGGTGWLPNGHRIGGRLGPLANGDAGYTVNGVVGAVTRLQIRHNNDPNNKQAALSVTGNVFGGTQNPSPASGATVLIDQAQAQVWYVNVPQGGTITLNHGVQQNGGPMHVVLDYGNPGGTPGTVNFSSGFKFAGGTPAATPSSAVGGVTAYTFIAQPSGGRFLEISRAVAVPRA